MARPYFAAKHVESMSLLPENLTIGRAYFVDDEQVIVIDHGRGPVVYGKSPGPQGIAGEPIPQLQDQINALAEAELTTQRTIWEINEREENAAIEQIETSVETPEETPAETPDETQAETPAETPDDQTVEVTITEDAIEEIANKVADEVIDQLDNDEVTEDDSDN